MIVCGTATGRGEPVLDEDEHVPFMTGILQSDWDEDGASVRFMCLISDERLATGGVDGHEDGDDGNALAKDSRGNDGKLWRENVLLLLVAVLLTGLHFRTVTRTRELESENRSKRPRERCFKLGRSTAKSVIVPYKQEREPTSKKSGECGAARKSSTDRSAWSA